MPNPVCTIIAGPNGSGKTTFALKYLPNTAGCTNFVNADMISAGLSPLDPDREWAAAGRIFLSELRRYTANQESFAFETTLAGRAYTRLIRRLRDEGWIVDLIFLWLPNVDVALRRIAERVEHGGHNVPQPDVHRRYIRGIHNLLHVYAPLCSSVICLDNSGAVPKPIFKEGAIGRVIENSELFDAVYKAAKQ